MFPASRRSRGGATNTFRPANRPNEQQNNFAIHVDGSASGLIVGKSRMNPADQRSVFGSMEAAERFDTKRRCEEPRVETCAPQRRKPICTESNFFLPRGPKSLQLRVINNLPYRPIAPGNGWSPLPPWDPAFPGAFLRPHQCKKASGRQTIN